MYSMSYCRSHFLKISNYINILVLLPLDVYQEEALKMTSILLMILEELVWCSVVLFQKLGSCVLLCFSPHTWSALPARRPRKRRARIHSERQAREEHEPPLLLALLR